MLKLYKIRQLVSTIVYGIIVPLFGGLGLTKIVSTSSLAPMIAGVALIGTLSYIFYYNSIDKIGPVKATGLNITYSIWAIVFEMVFLDTPITARLILCSILIIIGSVMVWKKADKRRINMRAILLAAGMGTRLRP